MSKESYYQEWFESKDAQDRLEWFNRDESREILDLKDKTAGVYEVLYKSVRSGIVISAYIGSALDLRTAALTVIKRMLGNPATFTFHTGLDSVDNCDFEFVIKILSYEKDPVKREKEKMRLILENNPFLQDGSKFEYYPMKNKNPRADTCIHPWKNQRREAFISRLASEKARINQPNA